MPIIKSTSRKDSKAISQLVKYVYENDIGTYWSLTITHNISARADDVEGMIQAFTQNDSYRKKRKGGVVLYQDVLSFHPKDSAMLRANPSILENIAREYIKKRAPYGVVLAKVHEDKEHLHIHLLLSPIEKENSISIRMSRKDFRQLRREIERYQLETYPELAHSYVHESVRKQQQKKRTSYRETSR